MPDEGQVFISSAHLLESAKRSMEAHLKDLFLRALGNSCDSIRTNNSSTVPPRAIARTKKSPGGPPPSGDSYLDDDPLQGRIHARAKSPDWVGGHPKHLSAVFPVLLHALCSA